MNKNYTDARRILANNIVYFRLQNNWSQEEFAEELGTTVTYVSNLENGHRNTRIDFIENIADVLGVPIDQLLIDRGPLEKRKVPKNR